MSMISIFAIPKAFRGHNAVIQENAIRSWTMLSPTPEILLFGDDEGTEETAHSLQTRYMGPVVRNDFGTPLLHDIFLKAKMHCSTELLCYVNSDIILMNDFMEAVERVIARAVPFIMTGQRWNLDIRKPLDFSQGWQEKLQSELNNSGELDTIDALDYFVFPRESFVSMPPFSVGRPIWDNWLLYHFRYRGFPIIDASPSVKVIHQRHDYAHVPQGSGESFEGPEAVINRELAGGGYDLAFTLLDRTHSLTTKGFRQVRIWQNWRQRLLRYSVLNPDKKFLGRVAKHLLWRLRQLSVMRR